MPLNRTTGNWNDFHDMTFKKKQEQSCRSRLLTVLITVNYFVAFFFFFLDKNHTLGQEVQVFVYVFM